MPSQSILKGVQDLNICVKVAKKNNIDYKLFSVTKDEFTPFLTKRLEWEILNQGGRPSLSPQFKGNHRKFVLIHFLFPEWVPRFQLGTGTGCELWTFCIFSSLPAHPTKGAQNPTSATSVHQPPMAPTLLSCPCVPQEPQPLRVKRSYSCAPHPRVPPGKSFSGLFRKKHSGKFATQPAELVPFPKSCTLQRSSADLNSRALGPWPLSLS